MTTAGTRDSGTVYCTSTAEVPSRRIARGRSTASRRALLPETEHALTSRQPATGPPAEPPR